MKRAALTLVLGLAGPLCAAPIQPTQPLYFPTAVPYQQPKVAAPDAPVGNPVLPGQPTYFPTAVPFQPPQTQPSPVPQPTLVTLMGSSASGAPVPAGTPVVIASTMGAAQSASPTAGTRHHHRLHPNQKVPVVNPASTSGTAGTVAP